jgi:hypothetical protein
MGGQAGRCEAEVPQEATQQPVETNERQAEGGVAGATQCGCTLRGSSVDKRTGDRGSLHQK